jgi:hypothetical protein
MRKEKTMYRIDFMNCEEDLEIEVSGDYQPKEAMTWHYPGCDEDYEVCEVTVVETGAEICLLPEAEKEVIELVLEEIKEEAEYNKYGYLMN